MTRAEFQAELSRRLAQMPPEEREKQLAFYDELLSDMLEDGMTEAEATAQLGDPAQIARELLEELPLGTLVKSRVKSAGGLSALNIVLLVLGFPVWLPLLLSAGAVLLALLITLWAVVISIGAVVLSLGVTAVALPFGGLLFNVVSASPLLLLGTALVAGGLCVLGFLGLKPLCRGTAKLCVWIFKKIKSLFIVKEG